MQSLTLNLAGVEQWLGVDWCILVTEGLRCLWQNDEYGSDTARCAKFGSILVGNAILRSVWVMCWIYCWYMDGGSHCACTVHFMYRTFHVPYHW